MWQIRVACMYVWDSVCEHLAFVLMDDRLLLGADAEESRRGDAHTPIHALKIQVSIPTIHLTLDLEKTPEAIRFNKLSVRNPVIQRLQDNWRKGQDPSSKPPIVWAPKRRVRKEPQLQKVVKLTSSNDEYMYISPFLMRELTSCAACLYRHVNISGTGCGTSHTATLCTEFPPLCPCPRLSAPGKDWSPLLSSSRSLVHSPRLTDHQSPRVRLSWRMSGVMTRTMKKRNER
jgi:hypothetical protein